MPFRISGAQLLYGENMSAADQKEKHERTGDTNRKGKLVDFLYMIFMREYGAGENSGPVAREHELHPKEDFVSLARVARLQVLKLTKSGQTAARVVIPFFYIYDNQVGFHLVFEFAPGLFALHKFFEVELLTTDKDVPNLIGMCDAFLIFRGIMEQTAKEIALHKPRPGLITLKPVVQRRPSLKGLDTPKKGASAKTSSTKENALKKGSNKRS
ncbi:hypothetical protein HDU86_001676 [Geranomyces michiganensis]|nr:hypothetical protein HDU86_001676 [Geranomyces michiganensis]